MISSLLLTLILVASVIIFVPQVRRILISSRLLKIFRKILPHISQTEQEALDAGTVWWEAELFSGRPDWSKLLAFPKPKLQAEEKAFLEGPVEELCAMLDEWQITRELHDLPPHVWQFIKDKGFFGMIIPREYGGLGFSAFAHSEVIMKISSRSGTAAVTVMVPNSLGPSELLLQYGTEEQKSYYLPRLAKGLEVPCFGLTGPEAGSDASAIPDSAIICYGTFNGNEKVLGMRVTWEKRYITLGPVATLLGLAFKLHDPDGLLGGQKDLGITLALIPTDTPGVEIGRRHFPLDAAFQNGPNSGKDVFIPMEYVIGGLEGVGRGWRMLMNCLAAGRSISLPATSTGGAKLATRATGAYSRVRVQFKQPIGFFEGVEEALARIGGHTYMMDAARMMTAGAVDLGQKPSVISAIVKYHLTERGREVINDAMDVHGGKGICLGPGNYLGRSYQQIPVSITVEGANILTRNMIIFGQGAIRCHPYLLKEIRAAGDSDTKRGLVEFDKALAGHFVFTVGNGLRSLMHGLTGGRFAKAPLNTDSEVQGYYSQLTCCSASFAFLADISLLVLGGSLKRRERLSARLGDILSLLYLCSAVLKRFNDDRRPPSDLPLLHWSMQDALYRVQQAFDGVLDNFPATGFTRRVLRFMVFPLGKPFSPPPDELEHKIATLMLAPSEARDRLTAGIYIPTAKDEPLNVLEQALQHAVSCEATEAKLRTAIKSGQIPAQEEESIAAALKQRVITSTELEILKKMGALRRRVIMVDDFPSDFGSRSDKATEAASQSTDEQRMSTI
ncbi:acyl-CoA dehydrogenase [Nitrosospira multiformis]|uniref:Acyl-coenzyme A dehydrogenase n=1 Tax=Nitrosospira multiformis TaxID=1231 RepID=A0A1H8NQR2_9PROT|nr:acyl-CoA dehydrogenase [Nitrosospira multiformis]SEO31889.1 acyl-CoA dehydrogenase [Nitrosospira multiformis]